MFQEQQERASTIISTVQVFACATFAIVSFAKPRVNGERGMFKGVATGWYEQIWGPLYNNLLQMHTKQLSLLVCVVEL